MKFKKLISIGVMTLSLILPSCSCDAKNDSDSTPTPSTKEYSVVTKTIGTNGGQVKDEESYLGLNIPAGALKGDTNITAQYVGEPAKFSSAPILGFLCGAEFGPSGTVFEKPVQVTLKLDKAPINDQLSVAYYDEENKLWECAAEATYSNNQVTFEVTHFSKYQVLDLPISVFNQYIYIVREAIRTNKSDSWITQTYLEYLLDDIHVMDYYGEYNGYVYYPVGFQINGQYAINGKESDNNETIYRYGELNHAEFSSTTDYCLYGSMLSSYQEFKRQREQSAQENQEIIDILLVVFYKMCKPIIDLTAPDTELEKGESTTVTLHCHYRDSDNYFPNLRDIDLPYYKLTISDGLSHIKVDKTELTTNENGVDTFRVTSKDGKGEIIKVIFDVEGEYGQHAEGSITFYEEDEEPTFEFTVTMHEEDHVLCGTSPDNNDTTGESTASYYQGYVTITLDYSFTGTITKKSYGAIEGVMTMSDVVVDVDSAPSGSEEIVNHPLDSDGYAYYGQTTTQTNYFSNPQVVVNKTPSNIKFFYGEYADVFYYDYDKNFVTGDIFVKVVANGNTSTNQYSHTIDRKYDYDEEIRNNWDTNFDCEWRRKHEVPFVGFKLVEGTQEIIIDALSGISDFFFDGRDEERETKTTQTVVLTKINNY